MTAEFIEAKFYSSARLAAELEKQDGCQIECDFCGCPVDAYKPNEYHEGYYWIAYSDTPRIGRHVCFRCFEVGVGEGTIERKVWQIPAPPA